MALSFSTKISQAIRTWKAEGHILAEVEMTTTTGSGGADYSSGFDIQGNAAKFGFRKVFRVFGATLVNGAGTTVLATVGVWDHQTNKLRFFITSTGGEDTTGTTITANSKVRFLALGV